MGTKAWTRGDGPLAPFAEGFRQWLVGRGYLPGAVKHHVLLMGQLNRWLTGQRLGVGDLTAARAVEFLGLLRGDGRKRTPTMASLAVLMEHLAALNVVPPDEPKKPSALDDLLVRYRRHLVEDRGLTASTVSRYEGFAGRFLAERGPRVGGGIGIEGLTAAEVNTFLLAATSRLVMGSAKREAADLRSFLRFLYVAGLLDVDLGRAMPPVAAWRGTDLLGTGLSASDVAALVDGCDLGTMSGRRDCAILTLLARLGLRSAEVARLRLGDVDWRAGEVLVRGKARRQDRLPLPVDVGEALVGYLRDGRPPTSYPNVILTVHAPLRPIHPCSITNVVYRACKRAGLPRVGGHQLRHALATEMLRRGSSLIEIGQVLRQSDVATTSGYAKVDRAALRAVAQAWPGASR